MPPKNVRTETIKLSALIVDCFKTLDTMTEIVDHRLLPMVYTHIQNSSESTKNMAFCKILEWEKDSVVLEMFEVTEHEDIIKYTEEMSLAESLLSYIAWFKDTREALVKQMTSELFEVVTEGI